MTPQEIFDTAFTKVYAQGKRAHNNGSCVYLTKDGLRCAVGHLFNERENSYFAGFGGGIASLNEYDHRCGDILRPFFRQEEDLLSRIQRCHDGARDHDFLSDFVANMRRVAIEFNLSTTVIDGVAA